LHDEGGTDPLLTYSSGVDLAQSTAYQFLNGNRMNDAIADESLSGYLHIFNPSSIAYVKHFYFCNK
jgi:hypothetical protein